MIFSHDFDRDELGDDWTVVSGECSINPEPIR